MRATTLSTALAAALLPLTFADDAPCLTRAACEARAHDLAAALDLHWFTPGEYPTKGCFYKNHNAFWAAGTAEAMAAEIPQAGQTRLLCAGGGGLVTNALSATMGPDEAPCPTGAACRQRTEARGIADFYTGADFATKGCFAKNGKAFWSPGTTEAMSTVDLTGVQERVWCAREAAPTGEEEVLGEQTGETGEAGEGTEVGAGSAAEGATEDTTGSDAGPAGAGGDPAVGTEEGSTAATTDAETDAGTDAGTAPTAAPTALADRTPDVASTLPAGAKSGGATRRGWTAGSVAAALLWAC